MAAAIRLSQQHSCSFDQPVGGNFNHVIANVPIPINEPSAERIGINAPAALARFGGLEAITPPCRGRFRPVCAPAAALFAPVSPDTAFLRKNGRENAPSSVNLLFRRRD